ncbi:3-oxoacyl-ACP reductase FabG [Alkalihalobacillus pseudalcaliphilus]|uniref:3-oxoacyl-ACP reductase FabG n=1 Tax=Alkalihalobacillus pseudalcaliphilus TaxID=79884 RepID=UPI00064DAD44|nr:3-oxoacyl-ACP reductase FabG [Alkalihalobacillus pseudalcaliphilus]KMK76757.1 hypothetical protein AB990_07525 [Alkalihalobacillus pseudalcaliphilus]
MKTILVTGGTRGIGRGIVEFLANAGHTVHFTFMGNEEEAKKLKEQFINVIPHQADVRDYKLANELVAKIVKAHGRIDCLINNAGIKNDRSLLFMNKKSWNDVIETNMNGTFNYSKHVAKVMIKQKEGIIINISSISGMMGIVGQTNYSASKAGIIGFTKSLSRELGEYNIRVNAVCPGFIKTDLTKDLDEGNLSENIILKRFGHINDLTGVIDFLIGEQSSYITGQALVVDGGLKL